MKILYIDCTRGCHEHDLACALEKTGCEPVKETSAACEAIISLLKDTAIGEETIEDIRRVCGVMESLKPERVYVSDITTGHGLNEEMMEQLKGMPFRCGNSETPVVSAVALAILKYYGTAFGEDPVFTMEQAGCSENGVSVMTGEMKEDGSIVELTCNIDDMSPEAVGHAMKVLFEAGALDVYTLNAGMKKNRPGLVFTCMCRRDDKDSILKLIFTHLSTLGIRESTCLRHSMHRSVETIRTEYGDVRVKYSKGYGVTREKIEYEDLARISRDTGRSIEDIRAELMKKMH